MAQYVVFLRAVNVGGRKVPMAQLRDELGSAGYTGVATHIQSGNVFLSSPLRSVPKLEGELEALLRKAFGFEVAVIIRRPKDLVTLVESAPGNPLSAEARHYISFLRAKPSADAVKELDGWDLDGERARVAGRDVHVWLDKPTQDAKLGNAIVEKITRTPATNRNWTVVTALAEKWC